MALDHTPAGRVFGTLSSFVELPLDVADAGSGAGDVAGRAAEICACQLFRAKFHIWRRIALAIGFSDPARVMAEPALVFQPVSRGWSRTVSSSWSS